jgi:NAD(P) transhydrogenase subunit alpha
VNLLKLLTPGRDGQLVLDLDDVVLRSITVVHNGQKTWPPPPVAVSVAAPAPPPAPVMPARKPVRPGRVYTLIGLAIAALFLLTAYAPNQLTSNVSVFVLAVVIGYYVIGKVHHALHTPLMSVTNAISGIIIVGALLQIGQGNLVVTVMSCGAILLATINIFGGFAVTRRMLGMFRKA